VIRVVKVGGSLLDWPELPVVLDAWLKEQPSASNILISGGGRHVDVIRQTSGSSSLNDETAHWLAIDAMSSNSRWLADFLPNTAFISTYAELQSAAANNSCRRIVFDVKEFLREHESKLPGSVLPHDWTATSDSIAARVAEALGADELVLLKSADPPTESITALAERGFVDRYFPAFDRCRFRRRFVNLRRFVVSSGVSKANSPGRSSDR